MKKLIKMIFPIVWLKRVFLIYNQLKSRTTDRLIFPEQIISVEEFRVKREKNPFLELGIDINLFPEEIKSGFSQWMEITWKQDEYFLVYNEPGFIEPQIGWALCTNNKLIYPSLGFSRASHVQKPSIGEVYFKKRTVVKIDKVISLRDTGEENYFHFFNDVLPKLFFIEEQGFDIASYTIVVGSALYERPYFQYFLNSTFLKQLNWHVQRTSEWVYFNEVIFCKPYTHTKRYFDRAVEVLEYKITKTSERRIFLTRSQASLRFVENEQELKQILDSYNFEIVDASSISFVEQINLFSQCRYLIAVHGAGISNIIFRQGKKLSLLEIVGPVSYIPFHYIMICKLYGYNYNALMGEKGERSNAGGFFVDTHKFEARLFEWLEIDK